MRVGYCSPFAPMKSGISDFSEELVQALDKYDEIVIFSPEKITSEMLLKKYECHLLTDLDNASLRETLDMIVYHVGNNYTFHGQIVDYLLKYPGILELHEVGVHHLIAAQTLNGRGKDSYLKLVKYCHGTRGVAIAEKYFAGETGTPWDEHPLDMCMNRHLIEGSRGVIVHSEMVKQMVLGIQPSVPIACIMHHSEDIIDNPKKFQQESRRKLNLPQDQLIIGMFGFATSNKRVIPILNALKRFKNIQKKNFHFVIVGEPQKELNLIQEIQARNLQDNVTVTGFASLETFKNYMGACDFCLNLRYPTQGESSGSLHRMMGMGKPVIVTDIGTFADYPDDVVIKVRYDQNEEKDIYDAISLLADRQGRELNRRKIASVKFAKEFCDLKKNAQSYHNFFEELRGGTWNPDFEDKIITRLCELGLTEDAYTERISELLSSLDLL